MSNDNLWQLVVPYERQQINDTFTDWKNILPKYRARHSAYILQCFSTCQLITHCTIDPDPRVFMPYPAENH